MESDSSPSSTGPENKENLLSWQRSKSMDVLAGDGEAEVFTYPDKPVANKVGHTYFRCSTYDY